MMTSIKLNSHIGPDGVLTLALPAELWNKDVEVVVKPLAANALSPEDRGWPPGFFERTAGAWSGELLVREPQGEYEARKPLE